MFDSMQPPRPVDLMETAIGQAGWLSAPQRENIRLKSEDLAEGRSVWSSTPLRIQIEMNRRCQLHCIHCNIPHPHDSELDAEVIEKLFTEIGSGAIEVMPYLAGEPTLAPLEAIAGLCRRHHNYLSFTTNGLCLDGRRFAGIADVTARVTFSFPSHRPEVFARIAPGADFDRIVRNLRDGVEVAAPHGIELLAGIVIMDANLDHLVELLQFVAGLGIRNVALTRLNPNTVRRDELDCYRTRSPAEIASRIGRAMEFAIAEEIFVETNIPEAHDSLYPQNRLRRRTPFSILSEVNSICALFRPGFCPQVANMTSVTFDGTVRPCCRAHMPVGNLKEQTFKEIWNGDAMQALRRTFFEHNIYRECRACRDFFCDSLAASSPPTQDTGRWWHMEHDGHASRQPVDESARGGIRTTHDADLLNDPPCLDLSVIVLSWNTADLLMACLASLDEHPYHGDHEIIVVDNASPDGSADRVARSFPEVRLIRNPENEGYSAGNNRGIRAARGRFLLLLNSDTEVRDGTLDRLVRFLETEPHAGAVGPRHLNPDGSLQPSCMHFPTLATALIFDTLLARLSSGKRHLDRYFRRDFDHATTRRVDQIPGSCLLLKRTTVREVGALDEGLWLYFNDVDLCKRILDAGHSIHFLAGAEVMHYQHASTRKFDQFVVEWHANRVLYYRKYFGRRGAGVAKLVGLYVALRHLAMLAVFRETPRGSCWNDLRFVAHGLARVLGA